MIIWLASYPRSGNTFIRALLKQCFDLSTFSIYGDTKDIGSQATFREIVGHRDLPAEFDLNAARQSEKIFLIKTHELFRNEFAADRTIYIVRDGREATVSFFHHQKSFGDCHPSIEEIIDGVPLGITWAQHETSWRQGTENSEALFLKFEEVTRDPERAVEDLSRFLGTPAQSRAIPGFAELRQINPVFFRSGRHDTWRTEMPKAMQRYFWLVNGDRMEANRYENDSGTSTEEDVRLLLQYVRKHIGNIRTDVESLKYENGLRIEGVARHSNDLELQKRELVALQKEASLLHEEILALKAERENLQLLLEENRKRIASHLHRLETRTDGISREIQTTAATFDERTEDLRKRLDEQERVMQDFRALEEAVRSLQARMPAARWKRFTARLTGRQRGSPI